MNPKVEMKPSYFKRLIIFSFVLLVIKLALLPFVQEIDADGITRVYLSLDFARHPTIISSGNWPPLFFYLMGGALMIYENQFVTPVVVNIVLSIALLFPLFAIQKRLFGEKIAFLLCVFFSFSPIVFRMSLLAMSEIPFVFCSILSISTIFRGYDTKSSFWILLAGLLMGVAGGMRYEAWILGLFAIATIAMFDSWRKALLFTSTFLIFLGYWLGSNYFQTTEALNSFQWAIHLPQENSIHSAESFFRRIGWYPLSLMFAFGPIAFFFFLKELKGFRSNKFSLVLFTSFAMFFLIWLVNALRGSLLLQHRFSITLFLLSFSFVGWYFKKNENQLVFKTIVFSASAVFFSFVYSSKGARPIPRLLTAHAIEIEHIVRSNIHSASGFICDFWNWETSYYLPFSTGLMRDQLVIIGGNEKEQQIAMEISRLIEKCNDGVVLVSKNGNFQKALIKEDNEYKLEVQNKKITLLKIYEDGEIMCFEYNKNPNE